MADFDEQGVQIQNEITEDVTNKKCPNCGATVVFDPESGGMLCEFCGYKAELPKPESDNAIVELDFESATQTASFEWGTQKKSVVCKQCGAETIYDALETAAVCPFCGSTSVMPAASSDSMAPGAVCPFAITKEKAGERFTSWLSGKIFTPSKAKKSARPESFQGVYLPYWTYDAQTTSNFSARAGYDRRVKRGDTYVTETTWRPVSGVYQEFIDDETVMASKRNENSVVKKCEPFDFSKLVPYSPQVVAGFIAERYSIGLKEGWGLAQESIKKQLRSHMDQYIRRNWRCDRVDSLRFSTLYSNITYKYLLVPVWISSFKFNEKVYQFVVNGQTGKVGGHAPISPWRVLAAIALGILLIVLLSSITR
ncbi:MAG: TFIIB-type zinc ribbon-containing protein [Clostridiales bacterium]|nr:TFIIB-type zinc ribbon-containing protein [Clostridiales bacterium]MBR5417304.1 TFIIB-type zinc ribbon-containing protein [Clostridiales bacterium]